MPPEGQAFPQAEINLGAAVAAMATRNVVIEDCAVRHVGEYAVAFGPGCQHNRVENCELVDLGGGGVKIGSACRRNGATPWRRRRTRRRSSRTTRSATA